MKHFVVTRLLLLTVLITGLSSSCSKDADKLVGLEISGTISLNGTYMLDETHTKGPKFVHTEESSKRLITYMDEDTEMWGLMSQNYLVYKVPVDGEIPPNEQWECGLGVDKDKFRCVPLFGN